MTPDRDRAAPGGGRLRRRAGTPAGLPAADPRSHAGGERTLARTRAAALVTLLGGAALPGCASLAPDTPGATEVARAFHAAVDAGDGESACRLLTPAATEELEQDAGAPCPDALLDADLTAGDDVVETHAYGRQAQVVMAGDVVFLTVSGADWLVSAAGCTPRPERPYDCQVSAG
jgi:hypothetical protein